MLAGDGVASRTKIKRRGVVHVHVTRKHARMVADAETPSSLRSEFYSEVQCAQYWPHSLTQSSSAMA